MQEADVLELLRSSDAILQGHFQLSSGLHSDTYIQCARLLQYPDRAERLGKALAKFFSELKVDAVASPALGGVLVGHEVARALGVRAIFAERDEQGKLALRRGFEVRTGERFLVVEDVWTTGGSTVETARLIEDHGGKVVAAGALVNRSGSRLELPVHGEPVQGEPVPMRSLLTLDVGTFRPEECPLCRAGVPCVKPGSRPGG